MEGFIKIHRKTIKWEWFTDPNTAHLFLYFLLRANYVDTKWRGIEIKRGQFVTSLKNISKDTGLTIKQVRTALNHLKWTQEVAQSTTARNSIITVNNYDKYQDRGMVEGKLRANKGQAEGKLRATDKKEKKNKKEKNINVDAQNFENFENSEKSGVNTPTDPYNNSILTAVNAAIKEVLGQKKRLGREAVNRIIELNAEDSEDFKDSLKDVLSEFKKITWKFESGVKKPDINWLFSADNYEKIRNKVEEIRTKRMQSVPEAFTKSKVVGMTDMWGNSRFKR